MSENNQSNELAVSDAYRIDRSADDAVPSPVAAAHRILRGRYLWAFGLAAVLAAVGAFLGYQMPKLTYTCTGLIEVAPKLPKVLNRTEENGMIEMFDAFVESQAQLASSRRVVDMAMQSPEWMQLGRGLTDEAVSKFIASLFVVRGSRGQFVTVGFTDADPEAATTAVKQIIKSYMKLVEERESSSGLSTQNKLDTLRSSLISRLKLLDRDVLSVSEGLGVEGLDERYMYQLAEVNKLDAAINGYDLDIAKFEGAGRDADPNHVLTVEEIARIHDPMAHLLEQKQQIEDQIQDMLADDLGPNHPSVVAAKKDLAKVENAIAKRALLFRTSPTGAPDARTAAIAELKDKKAAVAALAETAKAEAKRLSEKKGALLAIAQDKRLAADQLEEVKRRLDEIHVESEVHGRISVMSDGDRPLGPDTDKRRSLATMGGLGGIVLGFGIVLLSGIRNARLRHIGDVDDRPSVGGGRFLGILPEVPEGAAEPSTTSGPETPAEMADFCVHHVRTMLQLRAAGRPRIVAITSPSPGDGKTTLALALGVSFAATGARTLVVDCDFIGHGVTTAMRSLVCAAATRSILGTDPANEDAPSVSSRAVRVSDLLSARRMKFQDAQIQELLAAAKSRAGRGDLEIDGTVRALEALTRSAGTRSTGGMERGVLGVLAGAQLKDCAIDVGVPNLSLLPVGDASAEHAESLSPEAIRRLFALCRDRYDTVIVDSGPVRGSLEAALTAAAADHVLMVVSRGGRHALLEEAITRLDRVGATLAGVVFNRALADDVANSSFASRSASFRDVEIG